MAQTDTLSRESRLVIKYSVVSLIGFAVDAIVLHLLLLTGMHAAWARIISLAVAMNTTFFINGRHVFHCLDRRSLVGQWTRYMATNGFGNFCNYWIFLSLVSTHWRIISAPMVALSVGAICAWVLNYAATRFLVFGRALKNVVVARTAPLRRSSSLRQTPRVP